MTLAQAVAKRTSELLKEHNMSQYRLIKETCLDKTTIQSIMKGKTKDVKLSTIFLIADAFNITISEFVNVDYFEKINIEL
ncbi:MAG: helix-turn-helix transcriptional regulator [Clostridia bacterium]|nr:helix-turn-helix transcriptional regulator [Clostridia bacterium]